MLTRKDIMELASNGTVFQRGVGIYIQPEKIRDFYVKPNRYRPNEIDIEAEVKGSGRSVYDVELTYRTDYGEVTHAWCGCPAFETYSGLCKHCVAVLLKYADYEEEPYDEPEQLVLRDFPSKKGSMDDAHESRAIAEYPEEASYRGTVETIRKGSSPQTTEALKALIQKEIYRRTAPVMHPEMVGSVGLYPYLQISEDGDANVSFKIGGGKPYVLKDVFAFADRMINQVEHAYGKRLSFIHTMEAFTPETQGYVRFLLDWVRSYKESYMEEARRRYYYYYSSLPTLRYVPLKTESLEKFMESVGSNVLEGTVSDSKDTFWTISYEKPEIQLIVSGSKAGAELSMECPAVYNGNRYEIFFSKGTIYLVNRRDMPGFEDFILCFAVKGRVFISKEDLPAFFAQLLPKLRSYMTVTFENIEPEDYAPPEARFAFYLDAPTKKTVTCRVDSLYGEERFNILDRKEAAGRRDLVREAEVLKKVSACFDETNPIQNLFTLTEEGSIYELLTSGIESLQNEGEVFVSDALKNIRVHPAPKVSVGISMSGSLLDLTLLSGGMSKEDLADILNRYDKKKKYHRLKNGDFIDIDEGIDVLAELKESLHLTAKELLGDHILLPKYRAIYLDQALKEKASLPVERDRDFRSLIRNMKTTEDNDYELPSGLQAELRSYQKRGFLWMKTLAEYGFGGILADDMGLGKTLQVITYLQSEYEEKGRFQRPHLIVCPASLVYNWESELQRFAPQLPVRVIAGSAAERKREIAAVENGDICITSYELLRRDIVQYEDLIFGCQVIDEAQYIKNHSTQAAKAVKLIRSSFRLALTGTPVENRLSELWSIFDFLMPGFLYGYDRFRKELEQPIVLSKDEEALDRLKKMIGPFVLRRLKSEVLRDLPDKIEKNMFTRLTGEQQKLYDADVQKLQMKLSGQSDADFNTSKIEVLAALTRLRQICCDPSILFEGYKGEAAKMELCMDLIENAAEGGHKILLFSQFTTLLEQLQERLRRAGFSYYVLTGATKKEERARLVSAFNQDDTQVFLISLKAGGTGLNLMAADVVIHFDPWWNLAVQNQATDRAHRIGQKNVVSVYKLIAKGTIEEKILELQEQKRQLADQLLAGSDMASPAFDRDELLAMLEQ